MTDREIAERLTRLETRLDEGLTGLRSDIAQLRADMQEQNRQLRADMSQLRADMQEQNRQLRTDMNSRFEEQGRMLLGIVAAFTALVAVNIGLVVWDRRMSVRPLEDKVSDLPRRYRRVVHTGIYVGGSPPGVRAAESDGSGGAQTLQSVVRARAGQEKSPVALVSKNRITRLLLRQGSPMSEVRDTYISQVVTGKSFADVGGAVGNGQ